MLRTPDNFAAHTMSVTKTARYYTFGDMEAEIEEVWFVCHGYSQLAERFIKYFEALNDGKTLVVAPEALSLFYLNRFAAEKGEGRKVGATWMTRENREGEIGDYVNYLETLCDHVFEQVDRSKVRLTAMGFSQGAATVSRWAAQTSHSLDNLILWAGGLPPDMDLEKTRIKFLEPEFHIVVGEHDELIRPPALVEQEARLAHYAIPYRLTKFDGGHHMSQKVLKQIAGRED